MLAMSPKKFKNSNSKSPSSSPNSKDKMSTSGLSKSWSSKWTCSPSRTIPSSKRSSTSLASRWLRSKMKSRWSSRRRKSRCPNSNTRIWICSPATRTFKGKRALLPKRKLKRWSNRLEESLKDWRTWSYTCAELISNSSKSIRLMTLLGNWWPMLARHMSRNSFVSATFPSWFIISWWRASSQWSRMEHSNRRLKSMTRISCSSCKTISLSPKAIHWTLSHFASDSAISPSTCLKKVMGPCPLNTVFSKTTGIRYRRPNLDFLKKIKNSRHTITQSTWLFKRIISAVRTSLRKQWSKTASN